MFPCVCQFSASRTLQCDVLLGSVGGQHGPAQPPPCRQWQVNNLTGLATTRELDTNFVILQHRLTLQSPCRMSRSLLELELELCPCFVLTVNTDWPLALAELSRACLAFIHPFVVTTTVVSSSVLHQTESGKQPNTKTLLEQVNQLEFVATDRWQIIFRIFWIFGM